VIITLVFSFQALLKRAEAAGTRGADAGDESHPEEVIDAEVTRIVNKAVTNLEGSAAADAVADVPVDGTDQVEEPKVRIECVCYAMV
jgi:hypothetical protein